MDDDVGAGGFKLLAETRHLGFDGIGGRRLVEPVEALFERAFGDDASGAAQQQLKQSQLAAPKDERLSAAIDCAIYGIKADIPGLECAAEDSTRAAQQRLQTRHQFAHGKRLQEIVVGAAVES